MKRMDLGLRQKDAAMLLDVSVCTITNWETGRTQPKRCYLVQLRRILDTVFPGLTDE